MCIYSPMPHTLSYCALIGKCALIRSNTVLKFHHQTLLNFLLFIPDNGFSLPVLARLFQRKCQGIVIALALAAVASAALPCENFDIF